METDWQARALAAERALERAKARSSTLQKILDDNVLFGLLAVDAECLIEEGATRSCGELLGAKVSAGDSLIALLGVEGQQKGTALALGVMQVFEDCLPEELALGQIPSHYQVGYRSLRLTGSAIRNSAGQIERIAFTIADISELQAARRESRRNAMLLTILGQRSSFAAFLRETRQKLAACLEGLDDVAAARRTLHAIKSDAACYQLDDLVALVGDIESSPRIDGDSVCMVRSWLESFVAAHDHLLGVHLDEAVLQIDPHIVSALREMLDPLDVDGIRRLCDEIATRPVGDLLSPLRAMVDRLGQRYGKEIALVIEGQETLVNPSLLQPVLASLSHLLRNAVYHGIEAPGDRGEKPARATVALRFRSTEALIEIEVEDDGSGIDFDRISARAVNSGICTREQVDQMDERQRSELLFIDSADRSEEDDIGGRGIGLAAVRSAVRQQGGDLALQTTAGVGTRVTLQIPRLYQ